MADFRVNKDTNLFRSDSVYNVDNLRQTGFNLGIVSNFRLGEYFDLRFIPNLVFAQRTLQYKIIVNGSVLHNAKDIKSIESTFLEFPLYLKFKSERVGNYRIYVIAGGQYSIDMVSQAKVKKDDKEFVKLKQRDYGYTIGVGIDCYMELFKLTPEIKMYNGLDNLLVRDYANKYSRTLSGLHSRIFMVSLLFE